MIYLVDVGFSDDLDNPTCKDTIVLEEMIIASERRFHKSQIIKGMDVDEQGIKSYISKITSWVLGEKKVVNVEPGNGQVAQNSVQATNAVPVPVTNSV